MPKHRVLFTLQKDAAMASPNTISRDKLARLVGDSHSPELVDVRGVDTARLDLAPGAARLLAAPLGFSRMFADDLEQLDASMALNGALYRWCRGATDETRDRPRRRLGN